MRKLRLFATDASPDGGSVFAVAQAFGEGTLTWNNRPPLAAPPIASIQATAPRGVREVELGPSQGGTYSFGLASNSSEQRDLLQPRDRQPARARGDHGLTMAASPTLRPPPAPPAGATASAHVADGGDASRRQIRGSSLLLAGRMLSLASTSPPRSSIVRYLSKADFGVFAYGLSMVALGEASRVLGLDKGDRALPADLRRAARLRQALRDAAHGHGTVVGIGLAFVLVAARPARLRRRDWPPATERDGRADPHLPVADPGARRRADGRRSRCSPSRGRSSFASTCWRRGCAWWRSAGHPQRAAACRRSPSATSSPAGSGSRSTS